MGSSLDNLLDTLLVSMKWHRWLLNNISIESKNLFVSYGLMSGRI